MAFKKIVKIWDDLIINKSNINFLTSKTDIVKFPLTKYDKKIIKDLKQTKFETHGLSLIKIKEHDGTTEEFKDLFDNWSDLGEKTEQETINTIQNLNIEVLVDLAGLWSSSKIEIFNTRICPLQISWLGFNNSTGMKEVDFILADVTYPE